MIVILPNEKAKKLAEKIEKLRNDASFKKIDYGMGAHAWYFGYMDRALENLVDELKSGFFVE